MNMFSPPDLCLEMIENRIAAVKAYSVSDAFGWHAPRFIQSDSLHNGILPLWVSFKKKLLLPLLRPTSASLSSHKTLMFQTKPAEEKISVNENPAACVSVQSHCRVFDKGF